MYFYGIGLWRQHRISIHATISKLAAAYIKSIKICFEYHKHNSFTSMLMELGLPSFNTVF